MRKMQNLIDFGSSISLKLSSLNLLDWLTSRNFSPPAKSEQKSDTNDKTSNADVRQSPFKSLGALLTARLNLSSLNQVAPTFTNYLSTNDLQSQSSPKTSQTTQVVRQQKQQVERSQETRELPQNAPAKLKKRPSISSKGNDDDDVNLNVGLDSSKCSIVETPTQTQTPTKSQAPFVSIAFTKCNPNNTNSQDSCESKQKERRQRRRRRRDWRKPATMQLQEPTTSRAKWLAAMVSSPVIFLFFAL